MLSDILLIALLMVVIALLYLYAKARETIKQISSDRHGLSVKYGKMSEQFMPFLKEYPYDKHNFRFIGNPIDGIQFEDDKIIIVEFKTGNSKLSKKQAKIRDIIKKGKVYFEEFLIR